jgi:TetR/AcrR family transcriptional regulator, transcriptional repressor for nem operon
MAAGRRRQNLSRRAAQTAARAKTYILISEMTDSPLRQSTAERRPGKRQRLVTAAVELLHQRGVERTTLADIAMAADVPVGNVYYYFKTKDDVIAAVIEVHAAQIRATLAEIDARHRTPKSRLKAMVREFAARSEIVAEHGCPFGSLCSELDKRSAASNFAVPELLRLLIDWAAEQFRSLGRRDAHDLALDLLAAYEGSALLANTLRDPGVLSGSARRVDRWIDSL